MASRVNRPRREQGRREEGKKEKRGEDQDPQKHVAQMAGSIEIRSWGQEAHEVEKFRVGMV